MGIRVIALDKNKFKTARKNAGMTQQQLADSSGVNIRQIQRVELGASEAGNMSARNLLAIADVLAVDPRDLIDKETRRRYTIHKNNGSGE